MDKVLSLFGLCYRAGNILLGEKCLDNMAKVKLVVVASDISSISKERYLKKCHYYNVSLIDTFSSYELSRALGRGLVKSFGITDEGFAKAIKEKYKGGLNG